MVKTGISLIAKEREEQIQKHGFTPEWDKGYKDYELLKAANLLLYSPDELSPMNAFKSIALPNWDQSRLEKMDNKPYKERLIIAGALIAAEIDRIIFLEKTEENER